MSFMVQPRIFPGKTLASSYFSSIRQKRLPPPGEAIPILANEPANKKSDTLMLLYHHGKAGRIRKDQGDALTISGVLLIEIEWCQSCVCHSRIEKNTHRPQATLSLIRGSQGAVKQIPR